MAEHGHKLTFLGGVEAADRGDLPSLRGEGEALAPGAELTLRWSRSPPWKNRPDIDRIIVGCHEERADVRLEGAGIRPEHIRVYFFRSGEVEFRPLDDGSTRVDGRTLARLEEISLRGGEELQLGPWLFRYD